MPPKKKAAAKGATTLATHAPKREGGAHGMERAQKTMTGKWPRIWPQNGDRVRFHFMTDGGDTWFASAKHHRIGEGREGQDFVCLRALTDGEEDCNYCMNGDRSLVNRFGQWIFVHYILHPMDNPKINEEKAPAEERKPWPQAKVGQMTMFKEDVEKPLYLYMSAGRGQKWFQQFSDAWLKSGKDLRKHFYELYRQGEGLDTEYTLGAVKEEPIPESVWEMEGVSDLPAIEDIFRDQLAMGGSEGTSGGVLGDDAVDTGEAQSLNEESGTEEEPEAAPVEDLGEASPTTDNDGLI